MKAQTTQCLAERGDEGSRGLQPSVQVSRPARVAERRLNIGREFSSVTLRRGHTVCVHRGLKSTATIVASLRDYGKERVLL